LSPLTSGTSILFLGGDKYGIGISTLFFYSLGDKSGIGTPTLLSTIGISRLFQILLYLFSNFSIA